ncbi:MAG: DUF1800 domain-containing protein [Pseudomonadota bacterium]
MTDRSALAAIRFGTGISPRLPAPDGGEALLAALRGPDAMAERLPQPGWAERAGAARTLNTLRKARRTGGMAEDDAYRAHRRAMETAYRADLGRTLARAAMTRDGLRERLSWFWADHFAVVDGQNLLNRSVAGYHEDAIRPHLAGRFADLLVAAVTHPAMLLFLDQNSSVGPNSPRGRKGGGLNENLAREVLELHTLGTAGPYGQADVQQLAELLTGLSLNKDLGRAFRANWAEPGAETILGLPYGGDTAAFSDIRAFLADLSIHPATARHLSQKLAVHFVADVPDPTMIDAMVATWRDTDGDLLAVYAAMLAHPVAWSAELVKARRPLDFVAASLRALDVGRTIAAADRKLLARVAIHPLVEMGQPWLRPPGPQGWPEEAAAWITPQALAARIGWAMEAPRRLLGGVMPDPRVFLAEILGPFASDRTRFAALAAEDRAIGIGLILAAPEFQRR